MKLLFENWRQYLKEEENYHPSEYINFMSRDCALLAQAINAIANFPMYGIVDERGDVHHVFAYDSKTKEAIDCRGRMPLERVFDKIWGEGNTHREISAEEIENVFGTYSDEEWEYAEEKAYELI